MADNNGINLMPAIVSNGIQYFDAVLAIDIGSTETRGTVVWYDGVRVQELIITNVTNPKSPLSTFSNQFSSRVLVHDDNPIKYIGNERQAHREESSAKLIPYILTAKTERFLEQYLILERLLRERRKVGSKAFHERLEEASNQFLCSVLKKVKCVLEAYNTRNSNVKHIQIKTVAMTIPSQWDLDFEELYRRLFKQAFKETFNDATEVASHDFVMVFHTEATALAQYIFHQASHETGLGGGMPLIGTILSKLNAQCFIDCGGHNGGSTVTQFHPDSNGKPVLYELGKPQGAGGGSEMWIHDVVNQLIAQYRLVCEDDDQAELPQWFYQSLKQEVTAKLALVTQEAGQFVVCDNPRGRDKQVILKITGEMSDKAFEKAFKHVKAMIESQLQELATIKQGWGAKYHIVNIIVTGGSSMHPEFNKWITALCMKLSLPAPYFPTDAEILHGPIRIALGAAYASLTSESVESFAEKCAFGLQKGIVKNQGEDDEHLDLEGSAATIWYQERGIVPRTIEARGDQEEYRIVCKPFLDFYRRELPTDGDSAQGASYDFLNIGTLPGGFKHRIEFMLDAKEEKIELKIHRISKPLSAKLKDYPRSVARKAKVLSLGPFPVHIQPGTRCLVIKHSTDEIDGKIVTAIENFQDDWGYDDTDCDETYRNDPNRDDTDTEDSDSDEDYHDDAGNAIISGSAQQSQSCSLGNSHDGPIPVLRRSISPCPQYSSGDDEEPQGNDESGGQNTPADVAQQAAVTSNTAASNTARSISKAPAINASTSSKHATFSNGCRIASKTETAHAASNAFRSSREVSGRAASNSQTGFEVPRGMPKSAPNARPDEKNMGHHRSDNVPSTRDASLSSYMGSSSMAPGSQGGPSSRNKRAAPPEDNNSRPTKRNHTSGEPSSGAADYPRQRASRPEPGRAPLTSHSAAQNPPAFENHRDAPARRGNGDYYRPSTDTARFPELAAPSRRPVGSRDYLFSNRNRDQDPESSVRNGMAELKLTNGVSASGSRPRGPAPVAPHRRDMTASRAPPAGDVGFRSLPVDSPRPGPSSRTAPESSPAGSSQHRRRFDPRGSEKGSSHPPSGD